MVLKIYFAGSIRAGRGDKDLYLDLIRHLQQHGTVLTEHLGDAKLSEMGDAGPTQSIYERDISWIRACDIVIAEVTTPSLGVGYELAFAEALGKKMLCLYREQEGRRLSAMIDGNPRFLVERYTVLSEACARIDAFVRELDITVPGSLTSHR